MPLLLLWIQILLVKKRRLEEFRNGDLKALTDLVDDPQLHGIVSALNNIVDGGFGNAAFGKQLILCHSVLAQQFLQPQAHSLVQFHRDHHAFFFDIIGKICAQIVLVAELMLAFSVNVCYNKTNSDKEVFFMIGSGLKKLAQENGMKIAKGVAYGSLQSFAATMSEGSGYKQIIFAAKFADAAQRDQLLGEVNQINVQRTYRVQNLNIAPNAIQVIFLDNPGTMKKINEFLAWFIPLLRQHGATPANICTECGCEITNGRWLMIDGVAYHMHDACAEKTRRDIVGAEQAEKEQRTGSYGMGILGAFLGSAIGAIVWALVLNMGYVASLVGLLIGWLAEKGYTLLKGKQGKGKIAILIVAIIFGVVMGTFAADYITVIDMINAGDLPGMSYGDIPVFIFYLLSVDSEYLTGTLGNVGLGLLFAALGVFALLKKANAEVSDTKIVDLE